MNIRGALSGITVLDLSRLFPGPYCSMILGDHGARVIAIEGKQYLKDDFFVHTVYRNKEHMALNLKSAEGREIFFRLAKDADVVIEGFRPGVVGRLGIDYGAVSKINPEIVYCSITGYGQDGDYRDRPGHDVNYISKSGVLDLIGEPGSPPSIPGVQMADVAGGAMNAVIGILLALFARQHTGKGQYIDISMTDGMVGFLPLVLYFYQKNRQPIERSNAVLSHGYACYNTYETLDGRYLSIGAVEHRFWKQLCAHLDLHEYVKFQYDDARKNEVISAFRNIFRTKTLDQWEQELKDLDVCYSRIQSMEEVLQDPFFRKRNMVVTYTDQPPEKSLGIGIPVKLSDTPGSVRRSGVTFGQDTKAILRQLGYSEDDIAGLSEKDII